VAVATSTLQANILKNLRVDSANSDLLARALQWLNRGIDKVQMYVPEAEFLQTSEMSLTLVVSQPTYPLPSDLLELRQLRNDDESVIIDIHPREKFDRLHPDPSDEDDATPRDGTLEYDRANARHILRVAPAPNATDTLYGIMRRWHPTLSGSQNIQYDKLQTTLEAWGTYQGSLEVYADPEHQPLRAEFKTNALEATQAFQQIMDAQKPKERQIPTVLKKSDY
jgi:hypothetical protein